MGRGVLGGVDGGLLTVALETVVVGLVLGSVLYFGAVVGFVRHHVLERISPPPERPTGRPIERIASDVRRVRSEVFQPVPGMPMARRVAISRAYDDLLVDACHALEVPDTLTGLPPGTERDAERLHVEDALTRAGLRLSA